MKLKKKFIWLFKRHPVLYSVRFKLLSKNVHKESIDGEYYSLYNKSEDLPTIFLETNAIIFKDGKPDDTIELCIKMATWIAQHLKKGPGLSQPSDVALKKMLRGDGGVCSDMVQIFNNFCLLNKVQVREWGVNRIPFDKSYGGHSFNEVFSEALQKWVLFDCFSCLYLTDMDGVPLSALEFYDAFRNGRKILEHKFYHVAYLPLTDYKKNYYHLDNVPFLISGYNNKTYDRILKNWRNLMPIFVIHFMIYVTGRGYHYQFPLDDYRGLFRESK